MQYIVLEAHPNLGGLWIGKIGTKEEVQKYVDNADPAYIECILRLEDGADIQEHTAEEFGLVWNDEDCEWHAKDEVWEFHDNIGHKNDEKINLAGA